jgi:hypothetical protein
MVTLCSNCVKELVLVTATCLAVACASDSADPPGVALGASGTASGAGGMTETAAGPTSTTNATGGVATAGVGGAASTSEPVSTTNTTAIAESTTAETSATTTGGTPMGCALGQLECSGTCVVATTDNNNCGGCTQLRVVRQRLLGRRGLLAGQLQRRWLRSGPCGVFPELCRHLHQPEPLRRLRHHLLRGRGL